MKFAGKYGGVPDKLYPPDIDIADLVIRTAYELIPHTKKLAGGDPESELIARLPFATQKINMQGLTPEVAADLVIKYYRKIEKGI